MRYDDIRRYLRPYSIFRSRKTTINHAFAAALAPHDTFDPTRVIEALACLGQTAETDLTCVYCDGAAETWDHLVCIVKDSELHGYGHQVGNLVPCCKSCNSKKGSKAWRKFLHEQVTDAEDCERRENRIATYLARFAIEVELTSAKNCEAEWQRYTELRHEVFRLMREADEIAGRLRAAITRTEAA